MSERSVQQPVVPNLQRASNDQRSSERNVLHHNAGERGTDGPRDVPGLIRHAARECAFGGLHDSHDVGLTRRHVHLHECLPREEPR